MLKNKLFRLGLINMNFGAKYWRPQYAQLYGQHFRIDRDE